MNGNKRYIQPHCKPFVTLNSNNQIQHKSSDTEVFGVLIHPTLQTFCFMAVVGDQDTLNCIVYLEVYPQMCVAFSSFRRKVFYLIERQSQGITEYPGVTEAIKKMGVRGSCK